VKSSRIIRVLCVMLFGFGALVTVVQPAQADSQAPAPGVLYEIYEPFSPNQTSPACVDNPHQSGVTDFTSVYNMTVWSCHSSPNELYNFNCTPLDDISSGCTIINNISGLPGCLMDTSTFDGRMTPVVQTDCANAIRPNEKGWKVTFVFFKLGPNGSRPVYTISSLEDPSMCMGVTSYGNGSQLVTRPCSTGQNSIFWSLG
jgi:hypothetical protein